MEKVLIIAEAGVNHNGDKNLAKQLIQIAAEAGADVVKFQTFKAEKLVSQAAKKAAYQQKNTGDSDDTQFAMLKKLELPYEWHPELIAFATSLGITFASTGFDEDSVDFLDGLGQTFFKIPSGEITNKPYLQHIARKGKTTILSTGMADMREIEQAVETLTQNGLNKSQITVLHCNTEYPTPMEDVNLLAMHSIRENLSVNVGYSDHTLGIEIPVAATALGAKVIEKHFTISREMEGPDHAASLEPVELKQMVQAIRNIEKAISGNGIKEPSNSEKKNKIIARKSLFLVEDKKAGSVIVASDLTVKRPGDGISPMEIENVIGKSLSVNKDCLQPLKWEELQ